MNFQISPLSVIYQQFVNNLEVHKFPAKRINNQVLRGYLGSFIPQLLQKFSFYHPCE